jgi:hypothetical protein
MEANMLLGFYVWAAFIFGLLSTLLLLPVVGLLEAASNTCWTVWDKRGEDGSREVLDACDKFGFPRNFFKVLGAHTQACVLDTVWGLKNKCPGAEIEVIADGCCANPRSRDTFDEIWEKFLTLGVNIVNKDTARMQHRKIKLLSPVEFPLFIKTRTLYTPEMGISPLRGCGRWYSTRLERWFLS